MDGKISQNTKPPTPKDIPSSVQPAKHLGKITGLSCIKFLHVSSLK